MAAATAAARDSANVFNAVDTVEAASIEVEAIAASVDDEAGAFSLRTTLDSSFLVSALIEAALAGFAAHGLLPAAATGGAIDGAEVVAAQGLARGAAAGSETTEGGDVKPGTAARICCWLCSRSGLSIAPMGVERTRRGRPVIS